jgi:FKBP-type peptidyl-prolyl cis-trans isomerase
MVLLPLLLAVSCGVFASGQTGGKKQSADVSYAFGVALGSDMKDTGLVFDYNAFLTGFKASMEGRNTRYSVEEAMELIQTAFAEIQEAKAAEGLEKSAAFLAQNATRNGVQTTASGLQYEVVKAGAGQQPVASDTVKAHYEGKLVDGTVFDSSRERDEPAEFQLDEVIDGWSEGIQLMKVGGVYKLYLPPDLAYGERGIDGVIPPNSALIFEVELLSIVK